MPTYIERYLAGEHEAVWRELQALGSFVRQEPVYSDAVEVARETMRRVRANIVTLIERLGHLDFRFGMTEEWEGAELLSERRIHGSKKPQAPLTAPTPDIADRLSALEARYGPPPISLRAFYEIVGGVNLCGYFRVSEAAMVPLLEQYDEEQDEPVVPETLDPLQVFAFHEELVIDLKNPAFAHRSYENANYLALYVTPDPLAKMGYSAIGNLETIIPCDTVDSYIWLEEPRFDDNELFVNTLRRAFRYGGFNHLSAEEHEGKATATFLRTLHTVEGVSYLDYLTRDLLPI